MTLTDPIPANVSGATTTTPGCAITADVLTCVAGPLAAGDDHEIALSATAPRRPATSISNTATVLGNDADANSANDASTAVTRTPDLADLSIVKSAAPATAVPGEQLTYTLLVSNAGPTSATDVSVSDALLPGLTFVSASPGCTHALGTVTCSLPAILDGADATFEVVASVASALTGELVNTATVSAPTDDPNETNNSSTVTTPTAPSADVRIAKAASAPSATPGQNLTYTLTAINSGPSDAGHVTVTDALPAGLSFVSAGDGCTHASGTVTCTAPTLADESSASFEIVVAVAGTATGELVNTATVSSATSDPVEANNTTSLTTPVATVPPGPSGPSGPPGPSEAGLEVSKIGDRPSVTGRAPIRWTVAVSNRGPGAATGVVLVDQPSLPIALLDVRTSAGTCGRVSPVRCDLGTIAAGATVTVALTGRPRVAGTLLNTAMFSTLQRRRPPRTSQAERFWDVFPVPTWRDQAAPFPCRSPRRSSANAAQGGLAPAPAGRRRRANHPPSLAQHRLRKGSPTRLLLQRS